MADERPKAAFIRYDDLGERGEIRWPKRPGERVEGLSVRDVSGRWWTREGLASDYAVGTEEHQGLCEEVRLKSL